MSLLRLDHSRRMLLDCLNDGRITHRLRLALPPRLLDQRPDFLPVLIANRGQSLLLVLFDLLLQLRVHGRLPLHRVLRLRPRLRLVTGFASRALGPLLAALRRKAGHRDLTARRHILAATEDASRVVAGHARIPILILRQRLNEVS